MIWTIIMILELVTLWFASDSINNTECILGTILGFGLMAIYWAIRNRKRIGWVIIGPDGHILWTTAASEREGALYQFIFGMQGKDYSPELWIKWRNKGYQCKRLYLED